MSHIVTNLLKILRPQKYLWSVIKKKKRVAYVKTIFNIIFSYVLGLQVSSFFNDLWPNFISILHLC